MLRALLIACCAVAAASAAEPEPQLPAAPPATLAPPTLTPIPAPRSPSMTEQLRLEAQRRAVDSRLRRQELRSSGDAKSLRDLGTLRRQRQRLHDALNP